jgi:exosortase/archaeosortase family protein
MGYDTALDGSVIGVRSGQSLYQINFSWDSTGWKSVYAMFALTFACGIGSTRQKLGFLAFSVPMIIFVNLLRVVTTSMVYIGHGVAGFDLVHDLLWSSMMVLLVVGVWYFLFFRGGREKG